MTRFLAGCHFCSRVISISCKKRLGRQALHRWIFLCHPPGRTTIALPSGIGLGAGRPDPSGQDGGVVLTQDVTDQQLVFSGLKPAGVKKAGHLLCVGEGRASSPDGGHS